MSHRYLTLGILGHKRLAVDRSAGAGCRIPNVPDSIASGQFIKNIPTGTEYTPDRTHTRIALNGLAVARCYTGRFLTTMLKAVKPEIRLLHCIGVAEYTEQATIFFFLGNHKRIVVYYGPFVNPNSEIRYLRRVIQAQDA
jgi:hypothetical protein